MKAEIDIGIVEKLLRKQSSKKIILKSLDVFKITKKKYKKQIGIYIFSLVFAAFVGISYETKEVMVDSLQTILDAMLGLFGIVFTGYAFFQALINKELLIRMIANIGEDTRETEKSKLQETNESFVECMMLNLLAIITSIFLKITINSLSNDFLLFENLHVDNIIATALISIYFYFILIVIWEIKSFIFNVFQLFNLHAGTRVLELFEDDEEE